MNNPVFGYTYHRILLDDSGKPIDYELLEANATYETLTGYKVANLLNRAAGAAIPEVEKNEFDWIMCFGQLALEGKEREFERYFEASDKWLRVYVCSPEAQFFAVIITDVTKYKKLESENRSKIAEFANAVSDLCFTTDDRLICTFWNKACETFAGVPSRLAIGKPLTEIFPNFPEIGEAEEAFREVIQTGNAKTFIIKRDSGEGIVEFEMCALPLEKGMAVIVSAAAMAALAEYNRLEERQVFSGGPVAVIKWQATEGWPIDYASPNVESILGYSREDFLSGRIQYANLIHPDDSRRVIEEVKAFIDTGASHYEQEYRLVNADGGYRWLHDFTCPIRDRRGGILYYYGYLFDVTERKRAEERLLEEKRLTQSYLDTANAILVALDQNGDILMLNRYGQELLGYEEEKILGKNWFKTILPEPEATERVFPVFQKIMKGELPLVKSFENEVITAKGERFTIAWSNNYLRDSGGKITGALSSGIDITERKRAEESQKETMQRLLLANKATNDVIWDWDVINDTQQWNESGKKVFGWTEIVERPVNAHWWVERVHADDRERVHESFFNVVNNPELNVWQEEYRFLKTDGTYAFVFDRGYVVRDERGAAVRMIGAMLDISERKRAEQALRESEERFMLALRGASDGVWDWDLRTNIVRFSPEWKAMLGFSEEEIRDDLSEWRRLTDSEDGKRALMAVEDFLADRSDRLSVEMRMRHKDGHWVPVLSRGGVVRDETGRPVRLVGTHVDLTERKLMEERIQHQNQELEDLIAKKDKFFSIISHDLLSPFSGLLGLSQLLVSQIEERDFDSIEEDAKVLERSCEHAYNLVKNLLEWSRLQTNKMEFEPKPLNISKILREMTQVFECIALQKSITLRNDFDDDLSVIADKQMISAILRNLISNAIKFTNKSGEIILSTKQRQDEIVISVTDNGVGIAADRITELFSIDRIGSTLGTEKERGTGLGLILCKEFVAKHGGQLGVESEEGKGSVFHFSLPTKRLE